MSRHEYAGAAVATTLRSAIGAADLTFETDSSTGWPSGIVGLFTVTINRETYDSGGTLLEERILCTGRSGNVFTVHASGRGYDGTTARAHTSGTVEHTVSGAAVTDLVRHVFTPTDDDNTQYVKHAGTGAFTGVTALVSAPTASAVGNTTNLISAADSEFESGVGTWAATLNCTVAGSATAKNGAASLEITGTGGVAFVQTGLYPVGVGVHEVYAHRRAVSVAANTYIYLDWYDAGGVYISQMAGVVPAVDSVGSWVAFGNPSSAPPVGATQFRVAFAVGPLVAGEKHLLDAVWVTVGNTGTALSVADSAHVHAREAFGLPTTSVVGDAQSTGAAASVANSAHVHARDSFGSPVRTGAATSDGVLSSLPHANHVHKGGLPSCTSGTRPSSPAEGDALIETDTDRIIQWSGAAWVRIGRYSAAGRTGWSGDRTLIGLGAGLLGNINWDVETFDSDGFFTPGGVNVTLTVPAGLGGIYAIAVSGTWDVIFSQVSSVNIQAGGFVFTRVMTGDDRWAIGAVVPIAAAGTIVIGMHNAGIILHSLTAHLDVYRIGA